MYINRKSNYDKYPTTTIKNYDDIFDGYEEIINTINRQNKRIICIETYPGVNEEAIYNNLVLKLNPSKTINSNDIFYDEDKLTELMMPYLTDDRVRGKMYYGDIDYFVDKDKLDNIIKEVNNYNNSIVIYGFGASLINPGDILIYAELTRWNIQLKYREGMPNYKCSNFEEDSLRKIKRGYFVEWRIADNLKFSLSNKINYYLDINDDNHPKMITMKTLKESLEYLVQKPFRLKPYFDPGVWGGQWMKEVCDLDNNQTNYAWSFDGVPEENSLLFKYGNIVIETPAMNLVRYLPSQLLGDYIYNNFGAEFPIRFDFLDTMDGQNLSLQVHPTKEYIKDKFGMKYTQDESYYILDSKKDSAVYLGLKENVNKEEFINELKNAKQTNAFDDQKYINKFPAKKHDHFLIPAGTIHCSASNTMVLEISATPYIFTFKLWDWNRLGLDGRPRPIHIEDGEKVIDYNRTTSWVKENLINKFEKIHDDSDYQEIKTGLHDLEFIETHVYTSKQKTYHNTNNNLNVLNLVDGVSAIIESPNNKFEPFVVHYVETFIIPACVNEYTITPLEGEIKFVKAYVRN